MAGFKNTKYAAVFCILLVSLIAEVFVFNFRYYEELASGAPHMAISVSDFSEVTDGIKSSNGLMLTGDSSFCIKNPGVAVNSIKINTNSGTTFTVSVDYTDDGFSKLANSTGNWIIDPEVAGSDHIRLITQGTCKELKFTVSDATGVTNITSVELNCPYFRFSLLRFGLLFLILLLTLKLRRKNLWSVQPGFEISNQRPVIFSVYAAAALFAIFLYWCYGDLQTFSRGVFNTGDCYTLLTEAFSHGSFSFLQTPPKALNALSNPYDPSLRGIIDYVFDSAFFKGHYYCYFGIAPVITLMLPFKLLTGLYMPTSLACIIYFLVMLFGALLLYYNIAAKWFRSIGQMPFVGGAIAVAFCANLFWLIARPTFYELAVICALCYLFFGFALLIHATMSETKRPVLTLCFSGLCFSLMVASRPTYLFYLTAALPLLLPLIVKRKAAASEMTTNGKKAWLARLDKKPTVAFFTPLAIFAVVLMAYNKARFGSPFDFGQRYQLTISDVRFNSVTKLAAIPGGIYHYFFAPLNVNLTFPFFHVAQTTIETSSGYYYNQPMAGLFNFPLLLILFASVYILRRMKQEHNRLKAFTAILLIMALVISVLNITLAGVLERYTLDIGPVLVFVSLILWFEVYEYFRDKGAAVPAAKLFFTVCIVTAVISTLCCCCGEGDIIARSSPVLFRNLSAIFEFWR